MHDSHKVENLKQTLTMKVEEATGEKVALCYQCGKCSAGCPLADEMDVAPNQVLRMLQAGFPGLEEKVLGSQTIWLCLSCETCVTRCPKDVDLPKIMDFLRVESVRRGLVNPKAKDILTFHQAFLESIRSFGRSFEIGMLVNYKMRTLHFFQDLLVAPKAISKGKFGFFPHKVHNREAIARMFQRTYEEEAH